MNRDQAAAGALASWTAAVLCRFCALAPDSKAPEDWRTPKPGGAAFGLRKELSEICACTASLSLRYKPVSGLEGPQRGPAGINELTVQQVTASACRRFDGFERRMAGVGFGGFLQPIMIGEALSRGLEPFGLDGGENPILGHDEAVALVEKIIFTEPRRSEVDGDEVGAGAESAAITRAGLGEVEGADGGNHPL